MSSSQEIHQAFNKAEKIVTDAQKLFEAKHYNACTDKMDEIFYFWGKTIDAIKTINTCRHEIYSLDREQKCATCGNCGRKADVIFSVKW